MKASAKIVREWNRIWKKVNNHIPYISYIVIWYWKRLWKKTDGIVIYINLPMHYAMFSNIHKYLPEVKIVTESEKMAEYLCAQHIPFVFERLYPEVVVMAEYYQERYPVRAIKKIQIFHGIGCKNYFINHVSSDQYCLVPGHSWAERLRQCGVKNLKVIGYPKTDDLFLGHWNRSQILESYGANPNKKTILYAPTWGQMSSVGKLSNTLMMLTEDYNLIVKLHDLSFNEWSDIYRNIPNVIFSEEPNATKCLYVADLLISDFSSIIFEFTPLYRPIIVFGMSDTTLLTNAPDPTWWEVAERVDDPDALKPLVDSLINRPWMPNEKYHEVVEKVFAYRDGQSTKRAVDAIKRIRDKGVL